MSLKFLGANNEGTLADAVAAINYATMMRSEMEQPTNLRVLNASWGQAGDSPALESAIAAAAVAEILPGRRRRQRQCAGQGMDIDQEPFYPAATNCQKHHQRGGDRPVWGAGSFSTTASSIGGYRRAGRPAF